MAAGALAWSVERGHRPWPSPLQEHGELEAAEPLLREQYEARRAALGLKHADTLDGVNNLALLLHQQGKLEEAEPFSRLKLEGCREARGDNHPDTVTALDTLSQLLSDIGPPDERLATPPPGPCPLTPLLEPLLQASSTRRCRSSASPSPSSGRRRSLPSAAASPRPQLGDSSATSVLRP